VDSRAAGSNAEPLFSVVVLTVGNSENNDGVRTISRRGLLFSAFALLRAIGQDTTFSAGVKVVNVLATVRDKKGQIIQNLNKDDFTLDEDGRPQTISYFSRETDLPLTLGLLIDTSMSQRRVLGQERTASTVSWTRCCARIGTRLL